MALSVLGMPINKLPTEVIQVRDTLNGGLLVRQWLGVPLPGV